MSEVPNRAEHPGRKVAPAHHYTITYNKPTGELYDGPYGYKEMATKPDTKYFDDKATAKTYGNSIAKMGFDVYAEKHDPESQQAGYTKGKPAKLMEAGFQATKFLKGY